MENLKLMLVEDEEGVRNAIARMVDWNSIGVTLCAVAKDGVEALQKIDEYNPDILLIDIRMPGKSGLEVIAEIACDEDLIIKSVVLSGYDEFRYAQKALRLGVVDYLKKPCRSEDILKAIETAKKRVLEERARRNIKVGANGSDKEKTTGHRFVDATIEYIHENYRENVSLASAAEAVYISSGYLCTLFKRYTGKSFVDYLNQVRLEKACELLKNSLLRTYEIAHSVGYKDERYFTRIFKRNYGVSPSEYKNRAL